MFMYMYFTFRPKILLYYVFCSVIRCIKIYSVEKIFFSISCRNINILSQYKHKIHKGLIFQDAKNLRVNKRRKSIKKQFENSFCYFLVEKYV